MKSLPLKTIISEIGGEVFQGTKDITVDNFATKRRRLGRGVLLFDLYHNDDINPGIKLKNCRCAVVTEKPFDFAFIGSNITVIRVPDISKAYWKFVEFYRNLFDIPVIGVTGTCGKTTTKEMIKHILSGRLKVNATYKSYNSAFRHLGYLLSMDDDTQAAVFEMGVAYPGDLLLSSRYFKPQVGVITNIGIDHLQGFGSLDAYIKGKAEFLEGLGYKGTIILNADDENIKKIDFSKFKGNIIYFGYSDKSHFKIIKTRHVKKGIKFSMQHNDKVYNFVIPGHAEFNVYNAAAAIAAAYAVGFDIEEAGRRLESFENVEKHFEFNEGINGSIIVDDTWSTNPTSAESALKLLKRLSRGKKTIAVLGKMSLLGKHSNEFHYEIGAKAARMRINKLVALGNGAEEIARGALEKGMKEQDVYFCKNSEQAYEILNKVLDDKSIALVKTSMLASCNDLMDRITIKK
ncbi:MAG TPA: UDP-N-acetylmuramoyl-tripeptide--D-alanyl-D-alanine ligase [Clostridiaceae bacterium]|nr:UDP-N-acetylmuramoyl-tripeptide--D-alanyl-D-alanine ligase [Clostridiaceae bacterium]